MGFHSTSWRTFAVRSAVSAGVEQRRVSPSRSNEPHHASGALPANHHQSRSMGRWTAAQRGPASLSACRRSVPISSRTASLGCTAA